MLRKTYLARVPHQVYEQQSHHTVMLPLNPKGKVQGLEIGECMEFSGRGPYLGEDRTLFFPRPLLSTPAYVLLVMFFTIGWLS